MALVSIVPRMQLGRRLRLDPEYYKPEYLHLDSVLTGRAYQTLSAVSYEISCGPFGSVVLCDTYLSEGISVIRPFNIKDLRVDDEEMAYISRNDVTTKKLKTYTDGDLVFSRVGDIRCGIVDNLDSEVTISPNIIAVRPNPRLMNPYFICVFMSTKHGYMQLERGLKIVAQPTIGTEAVAGLLIPELGDDLQAGVEGTVRLAFSELTKSKEIYCQAQHLLLQRLGLDNYEPRYDLSYVAGLSATLGAHRLDAEFFQPSYETIESHLTNNFAAPPIRRLQSVEVTTGQYSEEYVSEAEGVPYIRGVDIAYGTIRMDGLCFIARAKQDNAKKAKEGDVVVTRVGTIGLSATIPSECDGGTISDNLIRIRLNEDHLNPYYLALFLGSPIGVSLMIRNSRGSVQQRLNQETLKEILVPLLPLPFQQQLESLIRRSHEARKSAKQLLDEAKRQVEDAIEEAAGGSS